MDGAAKLHCQYQYCFSMHLVGVYKPRVRCYDVAQMSMKFERCMDSEVIRFLLLADDYTKVVLFFITAFCVLSYDR